MYTLYRLYLSTIDFYPDYSLRCNECVQCHQHGQSYKFCFGRGEQDYPRVGYQKGSGVLPPKNINLKACRQGANI